MARVAAQEAKVEGKVVGRQGSGSVEAEGALVGVGVEAAGLEAILAVGTAAAGRRES